MPPTGHIYFHSPCFDGIASAVLTMDSMGTRENWRDPGLHPLNYNLRGQWLSFPLEAPAAVVDFLYHPRADFWADHHLTTFVTNAAREHFETHRSLDRNYDSKAPSCALLLWRRLHDRFGYRNERFKELVEWSTKIDAAQYESVEEAVLGSHAALQINRSLSIDATNEFSIRMVSELHRRTIAEVASLPQVKERSTRAKHLTEEGLERFRNTVQIHADGIVEFNVDSSGVLINRYAPFLYYPEARYAAGVVRSNGSAKVTVMRNPWLDFNNVPLGPLCEDLGGGGHHRVGSVLLKDSKSVEAPALLRRLLLRVREEEKKAATNS